MSSLPSLRNRLTERAIVAPGIFDGVSARVLAKSGADAAYMTGFGIAGSLLGVPDIGIVSASEMIERVRALAQACAPLPLIADGDNGHGGTANVERLVRGYEQAGACAIQLEDQVLPKRCGHMDGKELVSIEDAALKIKAAVQSRSSKDFLIIARTDARSVTGMDDAFRRADAFLAAGADILFIEAPQSQNELASIGRRYQGVPLLANMVEDGKTPMLSVSELEMLGFRLVIYPVSALLAAAKTYAQVYSNLLAGKPVDGQNRMTFQSYNDLMGLQRYLEQP